MAEVESNHRPLDQAGALTIRPPLPMVHTYGKWELHIGHILIGLLFMRFMLLSSTSGVSMISQRDAKKGNNKK